MAIFTDVKVYICCVWILLLSWSIAGVYCQLDVQFEVHDVVAIRKESAFMTCKISGQDASGNIIWFKHRKQIHDKNIKMFANGTLYFPVVRDKETLTDVGIYQCCLKINNSIICSEDVELSLAAMPKFSRTRVNPKYEAGQAVRLTCPMEGAIPSPKITWFKDKQEIVQGDRIIVLSSGVLQLVRLRLDQAGRYRCQTSNLAGKRNGSIITLSVSPTLAPDLQPVVVWSPKDVHVPVGGEVELECLIEGPLDMEVIWTRADGKSLRNPKYTGMKNLHLTNVVLEDAGTYVCRATVPGTQTDVSVSAQVVVILLPTISKGPMNRSSKMRLTERFYCTVHSNSPTTVKWYKDGQPSQSIVDTVTNNLVLYDVKLEDAGIYQCLATNEAGSVQKSAMLEIQSAASIPSAPFSVRGISTTPSQIMVMCLVNGEMQEDIIATTINVQSVDDVSELHELVEPSFFHTYFVSDLKPYTNYSVYLQVFTRMSSSLPSTMIYVLTNEAEPARYPDFKLSSSHPLSIDVSWEPIARDQCNGIITKYKIVYKQRSTSPKEIIVNSTRLRATITGLQPDTQYNIQMAAATRAGYGPLSDWTQFRTIDSLTALSPDVQFYNVTNSSVTLSWKQTGLINIKGFNVNVSVPKQDKVLLQYMLPPQTQEYVINALHANTDYIIRVSVVNGNRSGNPAVLHVTTKDTFSTSVNSKILPGPRDIIFQFIDYNLIVIQWKPPDTAFQVNKYRLRYQPLNMDWEYKEINIDSGEVLRLTITNLQPYTWYKLGLQSIGNGMESQYEYYTIQTKADKPRTPPSDFKAKPLDAHSVQISWEPPQKPNGIIIEYIILYNINITLPEKHWETQQRNGSEKVSKVNNLRPNTEYFFQMKAKNRIGESPATDVVSARTLIDSELGELNAGRPSMMDGILLGIAISVPCIVACIIFVVMMKRLVGNGNRQVMRHQIENMRRDNGSHRTAVSVTSAQANILVNYRHRMFQNDNRQFGNINGHAGNMNNDHEDDEEVPLSVRLLSGEFDNDPQLHEEPAQEDDSMLPSTSESAQMGDPMLASASEPAQEKDPMLPRVGMNTADAGIEDVKNDPQDSLLMAKSLNIIEGVQTDDESSLEMQTTTEVGVDISSGGKANTSV
ncbi:protogenin A-like isoform X3 [Anneissia japonica]|uniref:protogenin A-like isoform X3 n=1 Tax=Anneissia japonica TaxID=1529436 RepID=UPI0014257F7A|nr:protogenin A-like isoform X3 [Anneissia japonica]